MARRVFVDNVIAGRRNGLIPAPFFGLGKRYWREKTYYEKLEVRRDEGFP